MPMIESFPFYPGFTDNEMLSLRLALGSATTEWRSKAIDAFKAGSADEADVCNQIADRYSALWGKVQECHDRNAAIRRDGFDWRTLPNGGLPPEC